MPITRLEDGRYAIRYTLTGKRGGPRQFEILGQISHARAKAIYAERLAGRGKPNDGEEMATTFATIANDYLAIHGPEMSDGARERAESILRLHVLPVIGDEAISTEKRIVRRWPKIILKWRIKRANEGASASTINREWNTVRAVFNHAVLVGDIDANPIPRGVVKSLTIVEPPPVYFTPEEWASFINALDDEDRWKAYVAKRQKFGVVKIGAAIDTPRRYGAGRNPESVATAEWRANLLAARPIFNALLWTGSRLGEILTLRNDDIDRRAGIIYIRQHKTSKPKGIPMTPELRADIDAMPRGVGAALVYTRSDGQPFSKREVQRAFVVYRDVAGLRTSLHVHSIRHTVGSWLAIQGVSLNTIREVLGHSNGRTTLRYMHLSPSNLTSAFDQLRDMKNGSGGAGGNEQITGVAVTAEKIGSQSGANRGTDGRGRRA
jgi:integrase